MILFDLLQECESCSFTGSRINDIRVIGIMIVLVLFLVALIGLDWEAKVSLPPLPPSFSLSLCRSLFPSLPLSLHPSLYEDHVLCHPWLQVQLVLLVILLIAIADFLIGTFIPRGFDSQDRDRGFMGYSGTCIPLYMHVVTQPLVCVCTVLNLIQRMEKK